MGGHSNCALGPPSLRMQAYDKAKVDPNIKHPCKHVAKMNLPGFFRCCVFRWKKQREVQKWSLLCQACPHLAKKYKEPPNVLRKIIGHSLKFQHRTKLDGGDSLLPPECETAIASCVVPRTDVELQWCINDYLYTYILIIYTYRQRSGCLLGRLVKTRYTYANLIEMYTFFLDIYIERERYEYTNRDIQIMKYLFTFRNLFTVSHPIYLLRFLVLQVERVQLGEEVDYHFVGDVIKVGIEQWNHCVKELSVKIQEPRFLLALVDETVKDHYKSEKDLELGLERIQEKIEHHLQPISVKETEKNILTFGPTNQSVNTLLFNLIVFLGIFEHSYGPYVIHIRIYIIYIFTNIWKTQFILAHLHIYIDFNIYSGYIYIYSIYI